MQMVVYIAVIKRKLTIFFFLPSRTENQNATENNIPYLLSVKCVVFAARDLLLLLLLLLLTFNQLYSFELRNFFFLFLEKFIRTVFIVVRRNHMFCVFFF